MAFHFFPDADFRPPPIAVQRKLYDCLEALRVAHAKLDCVLDEFDPDAGEDDDGQRLTSFDFAECQASINLHTSALQQVIGGVFPTVRNSAFVAIRDFVNLQPHDAPHLQGVMIALKLAYASVDASLDLFDADDEGEVWQLAIAARAMIGSYTSLFESFTHSSFTKECLELILAGKPVPPWKELQRAWVEKLHPDWKYRNGEPTWDFVNDEPLYMDSRGTMVTA